MATKNGAEGERGALGGGAEGRYSRQVLFGGIGIEGQRRLGASRALVVGCGALGCTIAEILVRAGVGTVRIVDRDIVEETNLQRQLLFDERDARSLAPKAAAAAARLHEINSGVTVEGMVADLTAHTVDELARGAHVLVDGTDNFETRFLINDWAVREGVPWIYGAAVGSYGLSLTVLPGEGPCLTCVFEAAPPPGSSPTCDTAGILAPAAVVVGALEAAEAMKILSGRRDLARTGLTIVDVWESRFDGVGVSRRLDPPCRTCVARSFPYLEGSGESRATTLCGRDSVQITPPAGYAVDLASLAERLAPLGAVRRNEFLVRARIEDVELTVFDDGRAIVTGTVEPERARALYARYIGS